MRGMNRWPSRYEKMRIDPDMSAKGRFSSRFDLEGLSWDEIREIFSLEIMKKKRNPFSGYLDF